MIARLEPIFRGDWAPYGESLACTPCPPADALRVADLLGDAALLAGLLRRHALHLGCSDLRPVASAWSLHYLWALLPPIVAGASLLGHAFPVRPEEMHVQFDADGEALRFHVSDEGCPRRHRRALRRTAVAAPRPAVRGIEPAGARNHAADQLSPLCAPKMTFGS